MHCKHHEPRLHNSLIGLSGRAPAAASGSLLKRRAFFFFETPRSAFSLP